mmetsp:Transcript_68781/g.151510  ORF Transcript_68781/g.151510 Transcript_68781/m.151510 type:complete len:237 (-) Transcript_68781:127-837(-)
MRCFHLSPRSLGSSLLLFMITSIFSSFSLSIHLLRRLSMSFLHDIILLLQRLVRRTVPAVPVVRAGGLGPQRQQVALGDQDLVVRGILQVQPDQPARGFLVVGQDGARASVQVCLGPQVEERRTFLCLELVAHQTPWHLWRCVAVQHNLESFREQRACLEPGSDESGNMALTHLDQADWDVILVLHDPNGVIVPHGSQEHTHLWLSPRSRETSQRQVCCGFLQQHPFCCHLTFSMP